MRLGAKFALGVHSPICGDNETKENNSETGDSQNKNKNTKPQ